MTQPTGLLGGLFPQMGQSGSAPNPLQQLLARLFPNGHFGGQTQTNPQAPPVSPPLAPPAPTPGIPSPMTTVQQQLQHGYSPQQAGLLSGSWRPGMPPAGQPPARPPGPQQQPQGQPGGLLSGIFQNLGMR